MLSLNNVIKPIYDTYYSHIIHADSEDDARRIVNDSCFVGDVGKIWEDKDEVRCEIISDFDVSEIILSS